MADFPAKSDPEQERRRQLLSAARRGKATASAALEQEYHVRVYSEAERSALAYDALPTGGRRSAPHRLAEWTPMDETAITEETDLPADRSL